MALTSIEWTQCTWNPVTGCSKISEGCQNCYAERMSRRLRAMGQRRYVRGFKPTVHANVLGLPLIWKKPRLVFVNSMSDLFHEEVPLEFIQKVFETIAAAPWHTFQVLTKRSSRLRRLSGHVKWPPNLWMGVTVEAERYMPRIDDLRATGAAVRFVSFEPLLGPISTPYLKAIDWAIVGGESGPRARPMEPSWVRALRDACLEQSVAFFFKQWGGFHRSRAGRTLDGRTWEQYPAVAPPLARSQRR